MSTEALEAISLVKISPQGIFKYILINVNDGDSTKTVVRGFDDCEWHGKTSYISSSSRYCGIHAENISSSRYL